MALFSPSLLLSLFLFFSEGRFLYIIVDILCTFSLRKSLKKRRSLGRCHPESRVLDRTSLIPFMGVFSPSLLLLSLFFLFLDYCGYSLYVCTLACENRLKSAACSFGVIPSPVSSIVTTKAALSCAGGAFRRISRVTVIFFTSLFSVNCFILFISFI
jgi:hypothetical protein